MFAFPLLLMPTATYIGRDLGDPGPSSGCLILGCGVMINMTSSVNLAGLRVVLLDATSPGSSQASTFGCALNPWMADGMHAEIFSEPEGSLSDQRKGSLLPPQET